jgi:hypothetical protein
MATFVNLKTNESVEFNRWSDNNAVIIPAVVSYWGSADCVLTHEGMAVRAKANSHEMLDRLVEVFGIDRSLFSPVSQRPPVVNGQRVFAIKSARVIE